MQASKVRYESPCKCEGVKENVSEQGVGQKVQDTLNNINNNVFKRVYSFKFYYYMIQNRLLVSLTWGPCLFLAS